MRLSQVCVSLARRLKLFLCVTKLLSLCQCQPVLVMGDCIIRITLKRSSKMILRLGEITPGSKQVGQIPVGLGEIGLHLNGSSIGRLGTGLITESRQRPTQIVEA